MKNHKNIGVTLSLFWMALVAMFWISSCTGNVKPNNTLDDAQEENTIKHEDTDKAKDAEILVFAAALNFEQIEISQLIQQQSKTQYIKDLGKYIEEEYTKASSELLALASKKDIEIPIGTTEDGKNAFKKLYTKIGSELDRTYCSMVVESQNAAIRKFEVAANSSTDADIKEWAGNMIVALKRHHDRAQNALNESNVL